MTADPKEIARDAAGSPVLRTLARAGYAASGLVHLILGIIVVVIAFGGEADSDQAGAFLAIATAPFGFVLLWIMAILLWALALWQVVAGILARGSNELKKWGARLSHWGQAVFYLALGLIGAAVAIGARPNGDQSVEGASSLLIAFPGGLFLLGAIGLGIGIGGISYAVIGIRRGFRKQMEIPSGAIGGLVNTLGLVGYVAKGIALTVVGILLIVAAVRVEPDAAGGFDAAFQALLALMLGPLLVGIVGAGFIAYAVFCFFRTRYANI